MYQMYGQNNNEYKLNSNGGCNFVGCDEQTEYKYEYCRTCKVGYYREKDENDNYICIGYDGTKDTSSGSGSGSSDSSSRNIVEYALLIFILTFLI